LVASEAVFFLQVYLRWVEHSEADIIVVILPQFPFTDSFQLLKFKKKIEKKCFKADID
jgi:hypothetical protein